MQNPESALSHFQLSLPSKVVFGWGRRTELGQLAVAEGSRALLVWGSRTLRRSHYWEELQTSLTASGVKIVETWHVAEEPSVAEIDRAIASMQASTRDLDVVIAIGGGSAIDFAKALAARATNPAGASIQDYLEGVGTGATLTANPLPLIAVPTTSGTGSEATKNAVISVADPPCKKSLRSEKLIPAAVLIDPELTTLNAPAVTASAGMDALTQLIESYVSVRATSFTRALCLEGFQLAAPQLLAAYKDGNDQTARTAMAYGAFLSGVALANSGLGFAHGVAAALGAAFGTPHGIACAALLPIAVEVNRETSRSDFATLGRLVRQAPNLDEASAVTALVETIDELCQQLKIPRRLSELGVQGADLPALARNSRGNSMSGNPRSLSDEELTSILEQHL